MDEEKTVLDNVGGGSDQIEINGRKKHVLGYLQDFLFEPQRSRTPVKFLSGGERNRILLAKLFARPANVIVLDEPTNDLDSETLELLEEKLVEFQGTILMVSHDREFLNNVVTSTIVFEPSGINEYVGGYDDWVRQTGGSMVAKAEIKPPKAEKQPKNDDQSGSEAPRKLKYKERLELEKLPEQIDELEQKIAAIHEAMGNPDFFKEPKEKIAEAQTQLAEHETKLAQLMERWEELESLA